MKKLLLPIIFILWMALVLAAYFVVQKPDLLQIPGGLANFFLTILIPFWMAMLSGALGSLILLQADPTERLILGTALGMSTFGLAGFGLAMIGLTKPVILLSILVLLTILFAWNGKLKGLWLDIRQFCSEIVASTADIPAWIPASAAVALGLAFLLGLAPPIEDFDALFYHLTVPFLWLRQGAATSFIPLPHYWYPQVVEGSFLWPMALGTDTATHLIHLLWLFLSIALLWHWARRAWSPAVAWNAIGLLLTMPSLLWLAAWAYTDYALTFAGLAMLYSLWEWNSVKNVRWLVLGGLFAGIAVSVKYTGFIAPIAGVLLILLWERRLGSALYFGIICTLAALPWYLRNWIGTGNPIYPFLFGGAHWDSFLAQAYSSPGTGLGFDPIKLIGLPLTATLGVQDANFFDGRIGPFFLILLPLALWTFWRARQSPLKQKTVIQAIGWLALFGIVFWTLGVVNSSHLFQTRLLFPFLLPLTIPLAVGLEALPQLDIPRLKISFILRAVIMLVVIVNLINFGLQVTARNPLAVALGMISRREYIAKRQPGYESVLSLVEKASKDARIYFLFEPRSYGMSAFVQPDSIITNRDHDLWLYKTPDAIVAAWKQQGFTHVLLANSGADFAFHASPSNKLVLEQVEALLVPLETSPNGDDVLYKIP